MKKFVLNRLRSEIQKLHQQIEGIDLDAGVLELDLTDVMNHKQRMDLLAMILFLRTRHDSPGNILFNVLHDLEGLRSVHLGREGSQFFVPRSAGYAKRHPVREEYETEFEHKLGPVVVNRGIGGPKGPFGAFVRKQNGCLARLSAIDMHRDPYKVVLALEAYPSKTIWRKP